jgi:transglutaminase/protease-like cytokinesis protein 3
MQHKIFVIVFSTVLFCSRTQAQVIADFKKVDSYVQSLGQMDSLNMGTITHIITKNFDDNLDKVRAIYYWVANNIGFDIKKYKSGGNEKMTSDEVLKTRKANAYGYATLFQDMCSVVKIRCLTVDGYVKHSVEDINEKPDGFNHTWVVVQLGTSPESWYYADPTFASGYIDDKLTSFTKAFTDVYFFPEKTIFNYQHLPDNTAWLLGPGAKDLKTFLAYPVVKTPAYELGLTRFSPVNGFIKTKLKNPVEFSLNIKPGTNIELVSLQIIQGKKKETKTMDYSFQNGIIRFSHKFAEADTYPVNILVNNKMLLSYVTEVSE